MRMEQRHAVAVRLAIMDHNGHAVRARDGKLFVKAALLHIARRKIIMIIQPDLAHGADGRMRKRTFDRVLRGCVPFVGAVRM